VRWGWGCILLMAVAIAFARISVLGAAESNFLGMPGLWQTVLRTEHAGSAAPQVVWHCVYEDADPWIAFAQIQTPKNESCIRKSYQRTPTSLRWALDCSGSVALSNVGFVVFDTAQHYHGRVKITGTFMGYPISDSIIVDGTRRAACTSPQD